MPSLRAELGLTPDAVLIGSVGELNAAKDPLVFARAATIAHQEFPKAIFGSCAITFDDGVGDTVRDISAVCRRRRWPVTFYLPTSYRDEPGGLPFQVWRLARANLPQAVIRLPSGTLDLSTPRRFTGFVGENGPDDVY